MRPREPKGSRKGRKRRPTVVAGVVVCSQAVHRKAQGNRCSANACVGVRLTPYMAGGAGSVPELLNRAISALNFEPGSAGTGHGGWDRVALTTMKRKSAVPLPPKWENTDWEAAKKPESGSTPTFS